MIELKNILPPQTLERYRDLLQGRYDPEAFDGGWLPTRQPQWYRQIVCRARTVKEFKLYVEERRELGLLPPLPTRRAHHADLYRRNRPLPTNYSPLLIIPQTRLFKYRDLIWRCYLAGFPRRWQILRILRPYFNYRDDLQLWQYKVLLAQIGRVLNFMYRLPGHRKFPLGLVRQYLRIPLRSAILNEFLLFPSYLSRRLIKILDKVEEDNAYNWEAPYTVEDFVFIMCNRSLAQHDGWISKTPRARMEVIGELLRQGLILRNPRSTKPSSPKPYLPNFPYTKDRILQAQ